MTFTMTNGAMHITSLWSNEMVDIKIGKWFIALGALETSSEVRKRMWHKAYCIQRVGLVMPWYLDVASLSDVSIRFLIWSSLYLTIFTKV